jgi:hypothetical protein
MHVQADIETDEYWIEEPRDDDPWDSGTRGLNLIATSAWETDPSHGGYCVEDVAPGDEVVVLVEHYSDGDTFGSGEYMEINGVFRTESDALEFAGTRRVDHGYFGAHIDWLTPRAVVAAARPKRRP